MTNDDDIYIGASATMTLSQIASKENSTRAIQIQLAAWKLAKSIYLGDCLGDVSLDDIGRLAVVIDLCCNSLTALAGVNVKPPPPKRERYLLGYYKHWGLESEQPRLFKTLRKMNKFYTRVSKHFAKNRAPLARHLDRNILREFMQTTQDIWKWALNRIFEGNPPAQQLKEFNEEFD